MLTSRVGGKVLQELRAGILQWPGITAKAQCEGSFIRSINIYHGPDADLGAEDTSENETENSLPSWSFLSTRERQTICLQESICWPNKGKRDTGFY